MFEVIVGVLVLVERCKKNNGKVEFWVRGMWVAVVRMCMCGCGEYGCGARGFVLFIGIVL